MHLCPDDEAALARLVSDWARYEREEPGKRTAVLARTNAERRALSARMREVHLPPSDKRTTLTVPVHHPDRGKAPVPLDIAVGERPFASARPIGRGACSTALSSLSRRSSNASRTQAG